MNYTYFNIRSYKNKKMINEKLKNSIKNKSNGLLDHCLV